MWGEQVFWCSISSRLVLYQTVLLKGDLSLGAYLLICHLQSYSFGLAFNSDQKKEIADKVAGMSFWRMVRSSDMQARSRAAAPSHQKLRVPWWVNLIRMSPGQLSLVSPSFQTGERHSWGTQRDCIYLCEQLRIPQKELKSFAGERDIRYTPFSLLPTQPDPS